VADEIAAHPVLPLIPGAFVMSTDFLLQAHRDVRHSDSEEWPVAPALTFAALAVIVLVAVPSEASVLVRIAFQILMSNR